jgi:hypothetical protein
MIEVSIDCPTCGASISVPADALLVAVAADDNDPNVAATVSWVCATCADLTAVLVGWPALLTLITAGVQLLDENEDPLPLHPENPAAGAGFTPDDLLKLHELLASDTWFDTLAASQPHDSSTARSSASSPGGPISWSAPQEPPLT